MFRPVIENASEGSDSIESSASYALPDNVESLALTGTAAINGTGNSLNNAIVGNSASNVLTGAGGSDTLMGGAGNDTYVWGRDDGADIGGARELLRAESQMSRSKS